MSLTFDFNVMKAAILGQQWRLEPIPSEKKLMWRREIEVLLSVSDHIVELVPSFQNFPNGNKIEVISFSSLSI